MGIHRYKPTARQELTGRIALFVFGLLVIAIAAALTWFCMKMILGLAEAGSEVGVRFCWPLVVLSVFLGIVGSSAIVFAFVPTEDKGRGSPRGFETLSRVFDGFWDALGGGTRHP